MDYLPEIVGGDEEEIEELPQELTFQKHVDLKEEDVFDDPKPTPKMKPVKELEEDPILPETEDVGGLDVPEPEPEPKKKPPRRRRVMSEKQKQALAEGRAKAVETRRRKAEEKRKQKELDREYKAMENKKKEKQLKEWREEKAVEKPVVKEVVKEVKTDRRFTQKEVDEITFTAIQNYDAVRKERKAQKQKKKKEEEEKQKERQRLQSIVSRTRPQSFSMSDIWG
jgi:aspartate beta-hydroxylase